MKAKKKPCHLPQERRSAAKPARGGAAVGSKSAPAAPWRGPGRPFQPGPDPRRHLAGRKCKDAIEFAAAFNRALAGHLDPNALARLLAEKAMRGTAWAIEMALDRLMGRPMIQAKIDDGRPQLVRVIYGDVNGGGCGYEHAHPTAERMGISRDTAKDAVAAERMATLPRASDKESDGDLKPPDEPDDFPVEPKGKNRDEEGELS